MSLGVLAALIVAVALGILIGMVVVVALRPPITPPRRSRGGAGRFDEYPGEEWWRFPADAAQQAGFTGEPRRVRGARR